MGFTTFLIKLKSRLVNQKEQDYSMDSQKYWKYIKQQREHTGHGEKSNIHVCEVSPRKGGGGKGALLEVIIAQNFPKVTNENKLQNPVVHW